MKHVEARIIQLKKSILEMNHLVKIHLQKARQVVFYYDPDLAFEIINSTKRIEILKIQIDYDCRSFMALYHPVAIDLRLILSAFKIIGSFEKVAQYSHSIAVAMLELNKPVKTDLLEEFRLHKMLKRAIYMIYKIQKSYEKKDPELAMKVILKDKFICKNNRKAFHRALNWLEKQPEDVQMVIFLLDIIADIERIGDYLKIISEGIIFYLEAKMIKDEPE